MICVDWQRRLFEGGRPSNAGLNYISLPYLTSSPKDGGSAVAWDPTGSPSLPYVPMYSKIKMGGKLLAVGDEEGVVSILNTDQSLPEALSSTRPNAQWTAHKNAIFDLQWFLDDERIATASGDKSVGLWDTSSACLISSLRGHQGSVRTLCTSQITPAVLASGGRDGCVMIYDTRCSELSALKGDRVELRPVHAIKDAHVATVMSSRKRKSSNRMPLMDSSISVTSVLLLAQDTVLASAGAANERVHLWDMRQLTQPASTLHTTSAKDDMLGCLAHCSEPIGREHGIECLAVDSTGSRLLVSSHSAVHYLYSALHPHLPPRKCFTGHTADSFYIRSCFSPDGSHFVSGSSDGNAYIWQVDGRGDEPLVLEGHSGEVSGAAWCSRDPCEVATCGDDAAVRIWKVNRQCASRCLKRKDAFLTMLSSDLAEIVVAKKLCTGDWYAGPGNTFKTPVQPVTAIVPHAVPGSSTAGTKPSPARPPLMPLSNVPPSSQGASVKSSLLPSARPMKQRSIMAFLTPVVGRTTSATAMGDEGGASAAANSSKHPVHATKSPAFIPCQAQATEPCNQKAPKRDTAPITVRRRQHFPDNKENNNLMAPSSGQKALNLR